MKFASMEFVAFDSADVIATSGEVSFWKGKNMFALGSVINSFNEGSQLQLEAPMYNYTYWFLFDATPQDNLLMSYIQSNYKVKEDKRTLLEKDYYRADDKDAILEWITANKIQ